MAHYTVNYSCGHTCEAQFVGKIVDRERKIAWLEREGVCPECYSAKLTANAAVTTAHLPALVGTPKQVAYATTIRAEAVASASNRVLRHTLKSSHVTRIAGLTGLPAEEVLRRCDIAADAAQAALDTLLATTRAAWWIDAGSGVNSHVGQVYDSVAHDLFAAEQAVIVAMADAKKAAEQAERNEVARAEQAVAAASQARLDGLKAAATATADSFVTVSATRRRDDFEVLGADGRVARGFIDCGDWVIFLLDGNSVDGDAPAISSIASAARHLTSYSNT